MIKDNKRTKGDMKVRRISDDDSMTNEIDDNTIGVDGRMTDDADEAIYDLV